MTAAEHRINRYTLEELRVGMTESFQVTVTQQMQDSFRELSGDVNPMHIDQRYAQAGGVS